MRGLHDVLALRFYTDLGFGAAAPPDLEDGIPHLQMTWRPT